MFELYYNTPTHCYFEKSSYNYLELINYCNDNMEKLIRFGYYFTIMFNGCSIKKIGSQITGMV